MCVIDPSLLYAIFSKSGLMGSAKKVEIAKLRIAKLMAKRSKQVAGFPSLRSWGDEDTWANPGFVAR
jgi:hypothetical protein